MSESFVDSDIFWKERYQRGYGLYQIGIDPMLPGRSETIEHDAICMMSEMRRGSTKMFDCWYFKCWIRRIDKKGVDEKKMFVLSGKVEINCPDLKHVYPTPHFTAIYSIGGMAKLVDARGYRYDRVVQLYELFGALMTYKVVYELFMRDSWNITNSIIYGHAKLPKEAKK